MRRIVGSLLLCSLTLLAPLAFADCQAPAWVFWVYGASGDSGRTQMGAQATFATLGACNTERTASEQRYTAFLRKQEQRNDPGWPAPSMYYTIFVCLPAPMVPMITSGAHQ